MPGIQDLYVAFAGNMIDHHAERGTVDEISREAIERQLLEEIDKADFPIEWKISWYDAVLNTALFDALWTMTANKYDLAPESLQRLAPDTSLYSYKTPSGLNSSAVTNGHSASPEQSKSSPKKHSPGMKPSCSSKKTPAKSKPPPPAFNAASLLNKTSMSKPKPTTTHHHHNNSNPYLKPLGKNYRTTTSNNKKVQFSAASSPTVYSPVSPPSHPQSDEASSSGDDPSSSSSEDDSHGIDDLALERQATALGAQLGNAKRRWGPVPPPPAMRGKPVNGNGWDDKAGSDFEGRKVRRDGLKVKAKKRRG